MGKGERSGGVIKSAGSQEVEKDGSEEGDVDVWVVFRNKSGTSPPPPPPPPPQNQRFYKYLDSSLLGPRRYACSIFGMASR